MNVSIVNGYFNTNQVLPSGGFVEASFLITSTHDMSYGDINFDLNIDAQRSGNFPSNYSGHEDSLFLQNRNISTIWIFTTIWLSYK